VTERKPETFLTARVSVGGLEFEIDVDNPSDEVIYRVSRYLHDEDDEPWQAVQVAREDFLAMLTLARSTTQSEGDV
jgi:hypothetical protein